MKTMFNISIASILLVAAPSPCFALWGIAEVSKEWAKDHGMEIRSKASGPNDVTVELEFKPEGELKNFSRVDLLINEGEKSQLTATLREDRSRPGHIVVGFTANRTRLDKIHLWVMVPGSLGGSVYDVVVKDFVDLAKVR